MRTWIAALALGLGLLLVPSAPLHAADSDLEDEEEPPRPIPLQDGKVFREVRSIPYPSGAIYLNKGLTGSFLGGKYRKGKEQSLFQWQGEVGYYYTPWFSAGLAFKIRAGEPSSAEQEVSNRYFAQARFHKAWSKLAMFAGPQIGVDNLNIFSGTQDTLEAPFKRTNARLGVETGLGWKATRWAGLTFGSMAEYSLVGEESSLLGNELNLRIIPGLAVDVLSFTDTLRELVPALYVNVEVQYGFLIFNAADTNNDLAYILGVGLAF